MTKILFVACALVVTGCSECNTNPGHMWRVVRMSDGSVAEQMCDRGSWLTTLTRGPESAANAVVSQAKSDNASDLSNATVTVTNTVYQP